MFWLVILGVWMGWVESVYEKQSTATDAHDWFAPYPQIPECYLRPELIPLEMPPQGTAEKADLYVRFAQR